MLLVKDLQKGFLPVNIYPFRLAVLTYIIQVECLCLENWIQNKEVDTTDKLLQSEVFKSPFMQVTQKRW